MIPGSDKPEHFLKLYDQFFMPLRDHPVRLLELGIASTGSLFYWADYFPMGEIVGLDWATYSIDHPRIRTIAGDQSDPGALDRCGDSFDIIIDDCAHIALAAKASFDRLFPKVVPGGLYAIEDWGTGYWADWDDGAAFKPGHSSGMVGMVKDLLDRMSVNTITRGTFYGQSDEQSDIDSLAIVEGLVIVVKS